MPHDDSEQKKTFDYMTGSATGYADSASGLAGADEYHDRLNDRLITSTPTTNRSTPTTIVTDPDKGFENLLGAGLIGVLAYADYQIKFDFPWWGHLLFVFVPAIVAIKVLSRLGLIRPLRDLFTAAIIGVIAYFVMVSAGVV